MIRLAVAFLVPVLAMGQATFGSITGTVRDVTGAVVPGASAEIANRDTGISRTATTAQYGNFEVTHLNAGTYKVTVRAPGFKTSVSENVLLEALRVVRVDVQLELGEVGTEISVAASVPLVETEAPGIADVKSARQLRDLPLNIRSSQSVASGGGSGLYNYVYVIPTGSQGGGSRFSFGGARGSQNQFNVDGISSNSPAFGNAIGSAQPSFESMQEVRFDIVNNKAEFGEVANITSITKSGGNGFHGGILALQENSALAARPFFAQSKGRNIFNDFGGSLGGPIRRNRTFFFGAYEGVRQRYPAVISPSVPTVKMRRGDFSELLQLRQPVAVRNPFTGEPFPGNLIPTALLNSASVKWQDRFFPTPNFGSPESFSGNFRATVPQQIRHDQFDTRVDHQFSPRNMLYGRISFKSSSFLLLRSGVPLDIAGYTTLDRETRQATVSDTWTIMPHFINELKVGYTHDFNPGEGAVRGQEVINYLGLQGVPPQPAEIRGLPAVAISGFVQLAQASGAAPVQDSYQFIDQVTWLKGRHTIKTGVDFAPQRFGNRSVPGFGAYTFANRFSGFAYTDFLLGLPQTTSYSFAPPPRNGRFWSLSGFLQDDFKISSRLTLSFGLRYEYNAPAVDKFDVIANFDPRTGSLVVPTQSVLRERVNPYFPRQISIVTAADAGLPARSLRRDDRNNFQPRFGLAWRPFGGTRTVLRGGYGIFNDNFTGDIFGPLYGGPFGVTQTFTNAITAGRPLVSFDRPFLDFERGSPGAVDVAGLSVSLRNPYAQQWNLTVERDLGFATGLRVSYIGASSVNLAYRRNINQPPASAMPFSQARRPWPLYRNIIIADNGGRQIYHALSTEVQRKWQHGLSFSAAWTIAKNLTDVGEGGGVEGGTIIENAFDRIRERGDSQFTPRHRVITSLIWELPAGKGKPYLNGSSVLARILGDWQLSSAYIAQTGEFLTPMFSGADPSNTQTLNGVPDRLRDGNLPSSERTIDRWFDVTAFAVPPNGRFGNSGYGVIVGPGRQTLNLGLFRTFHVTERSALRFQATFTNALNHANFDNPNLNVSAVGSAGTIRAVQTRDFAGPRTGQFGIRYDF